MSFTKVQTGVKVASSTTNPRSIALGSDPQLGSVVCLGIWNAQSANTITSVVDANGNNYTITDTSPVGAGGAGRIWLAYLIAPANADKTVTVTFGTSGESNALWLDEFAPPAGMYASWDYDSSGSGNSTNINSPTLTVRERGELLYSLGAGIGVELGGDVAGELEMLLLVFADRHVACLVEQHVGRL